MGWLLRLFRSKTLDLELDAELRHHFDLLVSAKMRAGMTEPEARREACLEFGGLEQVKENCREKRGTMLALSIWQDLLYAARQMSRNPGFAVITVLTLGLGIGATSSIFSIFNATLLRPLPYKDPDRLVILWSSMPAFGFSGPGALTDPDYAQWEQQGRVFQELAAFRGQTSNLTGSGTPERLLGVTSTSSLFPLLGVAPESGRLFSRDEQTSGHERVVLISHQLWARKFASEDGILGNAIKLDGNNFTLIGVMPANFQFPYTADFWTPMVLTNDRSNAMNQVIARLRPGITLERAAQDVTLLQRRNNPSNPHDEIHFSFACLKDKLVANVRPALVILLAAVGLVLLIACGNAANLFLARATAREEEIRMRRALGAGQMRIVRQLLTESMLLAAISGTVGLLITVATRNLLLHLTPKSATGPGVLEKVVASSIDGWVLGFCVLVAVATGILFGLAPALIVSNSDPRSSVRASGNTYTGEVKTRRIRALLVAGEFAVTVLLLIGASLLLKSFIRLMEVNPGLEPRNVAVLNLELPETKYKTDIQMKEYHDAVLDRIDAIPGVRAAGTVGFGLPFGNGGLNGDFIVEGLTQPPPEMASKLVVSPDYFRALGIRLLAGRSFDRSDTAQGQPVAIVSRSFAERFWPGRQAIGKRIGHLFRGMDSCAIVGIVGDVKQAGLASDAPLAIYLSYSQVPKGLTFLMSSMTIVIRADGNSLDVVHAARTAVQSVDPEIPVFDATSMEDLIAKSVSQPRFNSILLSSFAALALILATIGIYGVMSYSVVQRRHEIGIRMALGAERHTITRMVVRQGAFLAGIGIAAGIVGALSISHMFAAFLFGVTPNDPATFVGVCMALFAVALGACYIPARRASRVDPMVALRYE